MSEAPPVVDLTRWFDANEQQRVEMAAGMGGMQSQLRPRVFGEKYWQRWVRSYPDIAAKYYS